MDQSSKIVSHAEARRLLGRAGIAWDDIEKIIAALPDPIDVDRDEQTLVGYGVTREYLVDALGGSP
jgi:hypothetical protein